MNIKNLHLIEVKYLPATNFRGSRVKLTSHRFNKSKTIAYNYSFNSIQEIAIDYLKKQGQPIIGKCEGLKNSDYIICGAIKNGGFITIN